jgi:glyoxylase-like metal-dependent hydrolase (beta-lactamase superfamily II)
MNASLPAVLDYAFATPPSPGDAWPVAPRLRWIRMPLPFALDHINVWLAEEANGHALIDCGIGDAATRTLWESHFATTLAGRPITRIVATHCHPDHVGNAQWLAARFGAPVAMTCAEFMTAHALRGQHSGFELAATIALFARHGMTAEHLAAMERRGNRYGRGVPELPSAYDRLIDGDDIAFGGARWRVVEGHGHSPEHASLWSAERGVLISGDMLLPKISTNVSISPASPDSDPLRRFLDSLAAFESLPADTLVLPSHGLPFRGIAVRVAQLRAHHRARLAELASAVRDAGAPMSAHAAVPVLFAGRELDAQQRFFAMGETIAHLNHLWHAGSIERRVDGDGAIRFTAD